MICFLSILDEITLSERLNMSSKLLSRLSTRSVSVLLFTLYTSREHLPLTLSMPATLDQDYVFLARVIGWQIYITDLFSNMQIELVVKCLMRSLCDEKGRTHYNNSLIDLLSCERRSVLLELDVVSKVDRPDLVLASLFFFQQSDHVGEELNLVAKQVASILLELALVLSLAHKCHSFLEYVLIERFWVGQL